MIMPTLKIITASLKIKATEVVCLPVGAGIYQHVIFQPDAATSNALLKAATGNPDNAYTLEIHDGGGEHVSNRSHIALSIKRERSIIILTTREL